MTPRAGTWGSIAAHHFKRAERYEKALRKIIKLGESNGWTGNECATLARKAIGMKPAKFDPASLSYAPSEMRSRNYQPKRVRP